MIREIGVRAPTARRQEPAIDAGGYQPPGDLAGVPAPAGDWLQGVRDEARPQSRAPLRRALKAAAAAMTASAAPPAMPSMTAARHNGGV